MRRCPSEGRINYFPDPPYLNTTCKNCGVALEHTGATSGVTWIEVGSNVEPGSYLGKWECGPCPHPYCRPGGTYHQHVPLDVVSVSDIKIVEASLAQAQASS